MSFSLKFEFKEPVRRLDDVIMRKVYYFRLIDCMVVLYLRVDEMDTKRFTKESSKTRRTPMEFTFDAIYSYDWK